MAEIAAAAAPAEGFYSVPQAARGRAAHLEFCRECHPTSELRGSDFDFRWRRQNAWQLYTEISRNMPEDEPGKLGSQTYADIIAYILSLNGYQQGTLDLEPTRAALERIPLGAGAPRSPAGGPDS